MKGADMAVYSSGESGASNGALSFEQRFASGFITPSLSSTPFLTFIQGYQQNNVTAFSFSRPLVAQCTVESSDITLYGLNWFIFAHGASNTFVQHVEGSQGQAALDIGSATDAIAAFTAGSVPADAKVLNWTITPDFAIPVVPTAYCYRFFSLPTDQKYQITQWTPIIGSPLVHHLVVYSCPSLDTRYTDGQVVCNAPPLSSWTNTCYSFYIDWALGRKGTVYPSNMGKPFGLGDFSAQFVVLEMHYSNPLLLTGQVDTGSGISATYTSTIRPIDVGVLTLGTYPSYFTLPPRTQVATILNECTSECSSNLPATGITLISSGFHMHTRGSAGLTRIIRNGTELAEVNRDQWFDFNYQNSNFLGPSNTIMPGDRLVTYCSWDTSNDNVTVQGGAASTQEMCFNFMEITHGGLVGLCVYLNTVSPAAATIKLSVQPNFTALTPRAETCGASAYSLGYASLPTPGSAVPSGAPAATSGGNVWAGQINSLQACYAGLGLWLLLFLVHGGQMVRGRYWIMAILLTTTMMEAAGFGTRWYSLQHNKQLAPLEASQALLILAPIFNAAFNYVLCSNLISFVGAHFAIISPKRISWIFITSDALTFIVQIIGAVLYFTALTTNNVATPNATLGLKILLAGLIITVPSFALFLLVIIVFDIRTRRELPWSVRRQWTPLLWALYFSSSMILLRSIYRSVEFSQGYSGYLSSHEIYFYFFDALPIVLATVTFNIFHPSYYVGKRYEALRNQLLSNAGLNPETSAATTVNMTDISPVDKIADEKVEAESH
ncbi:hypothetical protein SmJEL517_g04110 [Synchytrium microbalum]|uniref:DOMON domain-containing protein n=1 Tax=Synchytrium microbalum TaxID=1806994 RepID=A0A507C090_9FUNG|nr:uncharacterized protein SmJEL517_g04110 [Synchytrium microbalum]TPX32821.1 hypothetical protein SmJEL517_g04110 [Synchytrium microbalum]